MWQKVDKESVIMEYRDVDEKMLRIAKSLARSRKINNNTTVGHVAVSVLSENNEIYTGVSIETSYSLGYCAEAMAIGESLKHGNSRVLKMLAFHEIQGVISPCGKCREFLFQINHENLKCEIILQNRICLLKELLPEYE